MGHISGGYYGLQVLLDFACMRHGPFVEIVSLIMCIIYCFWNTACSAPSFLCLNVCVLVTSENWSLLVGEAALFNDL